MLCPECCNAFEKVIADNERLVGNKELKEVLRKLKRAFDEDKSGEYERILRQHRDSKNFH